MSEKEVKKWFEVNGETFSALWAKDVKWISRVRNYTEPVDKFYFAVKSGNEIGYIYFATESEALIVRRDIESWIKSVQGE